MKSPVPDQSLARKLVLWLALGACIGIASGTASALFLWLLDRATLFRETHGSLVYALPLAGLAIGTLYQRFGRSILAGNNLVIDTIHDHGPTLPLRMAPMVLFGTVLTHLFGGSAGREGTAVQIGASLADALCRRMQLTRSMRQQLLVAGVAGGFGSVFGTPLAGAIFGIEFVRLGKLQYDALVPALVAAFIGDLTTRYWGIHHTVYPSAPYLAVNGMGLLAWTAFAMAMALLSTLFIELTHGIKHWSNARVPQLGLRMAIGGVMLLALWRGFALAVPTDDYLGLGVPTIVRAFSDVGLPSYAFALKLLFTAVTLGFGYLGGEVTPIFFIGATAGNALAHVLHLPLPLAAGVGMAVLFGTAANTPIALSIMAVELLGANILPHVAFVSALAYLVSGQRSIYTAQRLRPKLPD